MLNGPEADDRLHNPDPVRDRRNDQGGSIITCRGLMNLGCIFILATAILALLCVDLPPFLLVGRMTISLSVVQDTRSSLTSQPQSLRLWAASTLVA